MELLDIWMERHHSALRILPGQLLRESLQTFFLPLQPGFPCPGALEIVADLHVQAAERFGFELDQITVLKWVQAAVIGATSQNVARFERVDRRNPFDAAGNLMRHVARVIILH